MHEKFCFTRDLTLFILVWLQVALALSNMRREKEVRQIQFVGYVNGDREDTFYENQAWQISRFVTSF